MGKPKPLGGNLLGWWSRRISHEHRLVYRVAGSGEEQVLQLVQRRYHYQTGQWRPSVIADLAISCMGPVTTRRGDIMLATIGYERAALPDFIATLQSAETDVLVDIRERAQSRRPGFSKSALNEALNKAGIEYIHLRELGDPADGRAAARSGHYDLFRSIFSLVMESAAASKALAQIEQLTSSSRICLMCFERDHHGCHRKIVAEALELRLGVKAIHLGVHVGAANGGGKRRVLHSDQGAAASI